MPTNSKDHEYMRIAAELKENLSEQRHLYDKQLQDLEQKQKRNRKFSQSLLATISVSFVLSIALATIPSILADHSYRLVSDKGTNYTSEIEKLKREVKNLSETLKSIDTANPSLAVLDSRLTAVENQQHSIATTILEDPDKALTARLLRDKQTTIQASIERLEEQARNTTDKVDTFTSTLLTIPVITFLLTILATAAHYLFSLYKSRQARNTQPSS